MLTLINGEPGDRIAAHDRGLHYGDGLFETISCVQGKPRWLSLHLARLCRGLARLQLPFSDVGIVEQEIDALAAGQSRCLIKLIITRGDATRRGYAPSGDEKPTRIVSCHPWPAAKDRNGAFRVGLSPVTLGRNPLLAGLKHLNRLEQVLAQQRMTPDLDEVLMIDATGALISGSMSNVFTVNPPYLLTPALDHTGVEGVMRQLVLQSATACGLTARVGPMTPAGLAQAQELFVTNIRLGVQPVTWFEGQAFPDQPFAARLQRHIDATWC
jgi:4-amino-4-deoxychorismate lyase